MCSKLPSLPSCWTFLAAGLLTLSFGQVVVAQPEAFDLPRDASTAWPTGEPGVDYNLGDAQGLRHGPWVRVYGDGALYYVGSYDHGTPTGSWWFFREEGEAISHIEHEPDNPLRSQATLYHRNGRVASQGAYVHATMSMAVDYPTQQATPPLRDGRWTWYDVQGNKNSSTTFLADKKHGPFERWLPNGQTTESGEYHQDQPHGEWRTWHDNGQLRHVIHYEQGELEGAFLTFYPSGLRLSEGAYMEGNEHGVWKFYLDDGRLGHMYGYQSGQQVDVTYVNGTYTDWYGEEQPKFERTYKNKRLDGPFREWHDQGEFVIESFVDEETGEPTQRRTMVGVELSREGDYVDGQLDGAVYHYNERGLLTKTQHYEMGALINTQTH